MPGFDEDRASSQVNTDSIEDALDIDTTEHRDDQLQQIREMRMQLTQATEQDPDEIIYQNIDRANSLLDVAQREIENGGTNNARMYEVCGQLINSITAATNSITTNSFGNLKHDYNMKMLEVKERELAVKQAIAHDKAQYRQGRMDADGTGEKVILMDRETLLGMIDKEEAEVQISSNTDGSSTDEE